MLRGFKENTSCSNSPRPPEAACGTVREVFSSKPYRRNTMLFLREAGVEGY